MQPRGRPNPKPSLTWGFIRVFGLHKIHYRTTRPPVGFRLRRITWALGEGQPDNVCTGKPGIRPIHLYPLAAEGHSATDTPQRRPG